MSRVALITFWATLVLNVADDVHAISGRHARHNQLDELRQGDHARRQSVASTPSWTNVDFKGPQGEITKPCRLLVFWAVGYSKRTFSLVEKNTEHLRQSTRWGCAVDVYLAHYDKRRIDWKATNSTWYRENVQFSAERKGYKFQLMKSLLGEPKHWPSNFMLSTYDWVWALDEDIDFTHTNVLQMLRVADESDALIALPSFTQEGSSVLDYPMQAPDRSCSFRYVPIVEVIFPLIRPKALEVILTKCEGCIGQDSTWGLNRVWCRFAARSLHRDVNRACAVIDETPVIHRNFQTLKEKYDPSGGKRQLRSPGRGSINNNFNDKAMADFHRVEALHKLDFVEGRGSDMVAFYCFRREQGRRISHHTNYSLVPSQGVPPSELHPFKRFASPPSKDASFKKRYEQSFKRLEADHEAKKIASAHARIGNATHNASLARTPQLNTATTLKKHQQSRSSSTNNADHNAAQRVGVGVGGVHRERRPNSAAGKSKHLKIFEEMVNKEAQKHRG